MTPGEATAARALLEARVKRETLTALRVFLAALARDARAAALAGGGGTLPLGVALHHWEDMAARLLAVLPAEVGSDQVARLAAHPLPERAWRSAQAVMTQAAERGWTQDRTSRELGRALSLNTATATGAPVSRATGRASGLGTEGETWRATGERLARGEATTAFGRLAVTAAASDGSTSKRWVAHHDSRTRPTHAAADGQTVPVGASFLVGGWALAYPGDPSGPSSETANCRCVTVGTTVGADSPAAMSGPGDDYGVDTLTPASSDQFLAAFNDAFAGSPYRHHVSVYSKSEMDAMRPVLTRDGKAGCAVHDHGDGRVEATALFNASGRSGVGTSVLTQAVQTEGVNYVECFGPYLNKLYERVGFRVTDTFPFDPKEAPAGWNFAKFDSPEYHLLRWVGRPAVSETAAAAPRTTTTGGATGRGVGAALSPAECGELWREVVDEVEAATPEAQRGYLPAQRSAAQAQV